MQTARQMKTKAFSSTGAARPCVHVHAASPNATVVVADTKILPAVEPLFTPYKMGKFELSNRMKPRSYAGTSLQVLPPLTRLRATEVGVPQPHMATYYGQRARPGTLLIAEATIINPRACGYGRTPGVYNQEQVEGWKPVVKAVHDKGGVFFCQLWHCGRAAHPSLIGGLKPVAPSAIAINDGTKAFTLDFQEVDHVVPEALTEEDIKALVQDYTAAARNAIAAGFDGVEIHAANGYLLDQFTKSSTNQRTDRYGGSIENRCRFALEVTEAVVAAVGADKVGIRLSPFTDFLAATDATPYGTFMYLVEQLNKFNLTYLHMVEARANGNSDNDAATDTLEPFRKVFKGSFLSAGGFTAESGAQAVASGHTDLVAYGRQWISNPDLPERFKAGAPLTPYDRNTFYSPTMQGYIDYPLMDGTLPQ